MTVSVTDQARYFKLARGSRIEDDFEDGDLAGWSIHCTDPQFLPLVTLGTTNGQLRIHGIWGDHRGVYCLNTNVTMADYAASIDILDWADGSGNDPLFALVARFEPGVLTSDRSLYFGGVEVGAVESPPQSSVWIYKWWGTGGVTAGEKRVSRIDTANDYRLVFRGIGGEGTAELYDLADLSTPIATVNGIDTNPLVFGWTGIYVNDKGALGTLDVTVDNFVAVGTAP